MWRSLSIYGRTFLLMLAALVVAEAVGIAFVIYRPPTHDAPVQLSTVVRALGRPASVRISLYAVTRSAWLGLRG